MIKTFAKLLFPIPAVSIMAHRMIAYVRDNSKGSQKALLLRAVTSATPKLSVSDQQYELGSKN